MKAHPEPSAKERAWYEQARCSSHPHAEWWFANPHSPSPAERLAHRRAVEVCMDCPVQDECANAGVGEVGLWGGIYRAGRHSPAYHAEGRCENCRGMFLRGVGTVDRLCDACLSPNELRRRRARDNKRASRSRLAAEVAAFEAGVDEFGREVRGA